jgi:hypothetical protein
MYLPSDDAPRCLYAVEWRDRLAPWRIEGEWYRPEAPLSEMLSSWQLEPSRKRTEWRTKPRLLEYAGEKLSVNGWAKRRGIPESTIRKHLAVGWTRAPRRTLRGRVVWPKANP